MKHIKNFKVFESNDQDLSDVIGNGYKIRNAIRSNDFESFKEMIDVLFQNKEYNDVDTYTGNVRDYDRMIQNLLCVTSEYGKVDMLNYILDNYTPTKEQLSFVERWLSSSRKSDNKDLQSECLRLIEDSI